MHNSIKPKIRMYGNWMITLFYGLATKVKSCMFLYDITSKTSEFHEYQWRILGKFIQTYKSIFDMAVSVSCHKTIEPPLWESVPSSSTLLGPFILSLPINLHVPEVYTCKSNEKCTLKFPMKQHQMHNLIQLWRFTLIQLSYVKFTHYI